jgi:general secretion pathway protein G
MAQSNFTADYRRLRSNSSCGFTLIEMLVVFTLIAMLLSIAVPRYLNAADNSRIKVQQQNLATLRDAIDKFRADQGQCPQNLDELVSKQYLRALPVDPVTGSTQWTPLQDPSGINPGVFDVGVPQKAAPPGNSTDPINTASAVPSEQGASAATTPTEAPTSSGSR